ncbi:uncharacterized protein MELLADRAFT_63974 [Melampsora larici-populina 98AG31]|uniref:Uncharacterized protein n=1 Tax=Melampsora larici-populina (strain 98AG31 / pathotype 3-4-7) TaxID=747676 RepID=F4RPP4_MELLP|nr:uncharacterized protein MELLADRAFT_63974 [Melampsora larici-populina 98AG31]EGG05576.1 hypothetical protein MELLADRAFT_63974 [Melampsora larici-populina 98AG31]
MPMNLCPICDFIKPINQCILWSHSFTPVLTSRLELSSLIAIYGPVIVFILLNKLHSCLLDLTVNLSVTLVQSHQHPSGMNIKDKTLTKQPNKKSSSMYTFFFYKTTISVQISDNNSFSENVEDNDDQDSCPEKDTTAKKEEEDPDLRGNSVAKDQESDEPGLAKDIGSKDEEPQTGGPKSTLGNIHREPFLTSSSDWPSINLPMGQARRAEWELLADIFDLDATHCGNALPISLINGSQNQFQAGVCLMQQVLQELGKQSTENQATATSASWALRLDFGVPWKAETLPPILGDTLDDLTAHAKFVIEFKD